MTVSDFPWINASLNATSASLLFVGWVMIKLNRVRSHGYAMAAALLTSTLFLACYLTYHTLRVLEGGNFTKFPESSWRPWYYALLLSHTILAIFILPLIGLTVWYAYKRQWENHKRISVVTLPLWFYVSVSGVAVYWMLYQFAPTLPAGG